MRRSSYHFVTSVLILAMIFLVRVSVSFAQRDTVEFKFIPKYYPEDGGFREVPPPEVVHHPKVVFPNDPNLQGKDAKVWMKLKVDRQGTVRAVQVLKSTDERFNGYATKYAKEFKFRWPKGWPEELKDQKAVWVSVPINFTQR